MVLNVTDRAADELKKLIIAKGKDDMVVRLYLSGVG